MKAFELADLESARAAQGKPWHEFLRESLLSCGLYVLKAGEEDMQQPHTEDEVYYVISGKGRFKAGNVDIVAEAGAIIYVEAHLEHRFHSITEDLTILVFFAPPEGSQA